MLNQRLPIPLPCHSADEMGVLSTQRFIQFLTSVSLLETEQLFKIVTPRADS
jgi:hypothetical protein